MNVLLLYDAYSTFTQTVVEHLRSFRTFSRHDVWYAHAIRGVHPQGDLEAFDAVIVHYSVRLINETLLSPIWVEKLRAFQGAKLLFIQDEYDATETARRWFERLGFDVVFTCVPPRFVEQVYPKARFPKTRFLTTLTGFVPPRFEERRNRRPIRDRSLAIVYRGRPLAHWYGKLAREKLEIGVHMKKVCADRSVATDIEWSEEARIYGEKWYDFVESGKATLGTESGANVFDDHGEIRAAIRAALKVNPDLSFDEAWERFLKPHEGHVLMNQASPKIFEAIALGTVLVLYEGEYSGVVTPWKHYLPLKKDLTNVDEVLAALADDARLQQIADQAFTDVIESGRWSYRAAVAGYDDALEEAVRAKGRAAARQPFLIMLGTEAGAGGDVHTSRIKLRTRLRDAVTSNPLAPSNAVEELGFAPLWLIAARRLWKFLRFAEFLRQVDRLRGR